MKVVGFRIKAKEFKGGLVVDQDFAAAAGEALCEELNKEPCFALVHGHVDVATQIWGKCRQSIDSGTIAVLFFGTDVVQVPAPMKQSPFVRALSYQVHKGADPKPFLRLLEHVRDLERLPSSDSVAQLWELVDPAGERRRQAAVEALYPIVLAGFAGEKSLSQQHREVIRSYEDLLGACDDMATLRRKFESLCGRVASPWQDRRSHLSHNEFGHRFRLILERPSNREALEAFLGGAGPLPEPLRILLDRWPRIAADFEGLFQTPYDVEELGHAQRRNVAVRVEAARESLRRLSEKVGKVREHDSRDGQAGTPALVDELLAECATFASQIEGLRHPMILQPLKPE
jgi:hypothetical protein